MNRIVLFLICALLTSRLKAQLTLDSMSYPGSVIGTDSLKKTTYNSSFPVLNATPNGSWDMSIVTDTTPVYFDYRVPTTIYQFADSNTYNFGMYKYYGNIQSNVTGSGILEYCNIIKKAQYSLTPLTSGAYDSIIINAQNSLYSPQRILIAFPATYNTSWTSIYQYDLNFQFTFLANGDTLAPGFVRTYTNEKDTVVGWGKMRVKDATGSPSDYLNVLQVQTMTVHTDSFFLNGVPFPGSLLTILGLTQGKKDTVYEQLYYRPQEVTPLAQVTFRDAAYTQPYKATTHIQRLSAAGVENIIDEGNIKIYPNPDIGRELIIDVPGEGGKWSYEVFNISGQVLLGGELPTNGKSSRLVMLPASLSAGNYYIRIMHDKRQVAIKALTLRPK